MLKPTSKDLNPVLTHQFVILRPMYNYVLGRDALNIHRISLHLANLRDRQLTKSLKESKDA